MWALVISQSFIRVSRLGFDAEERLPAELHGHRVAATVAQGVTAEQAIDREPAATSGAESRHRHTRIVRTTGVEATTGAKQRADAALVECQQVQNEP